jgi:hypothetical protein
MTEYHIDSEKIQKNCANGIACLRHDSEKVRQYFSYSAPTDYKSWANDLFPNEKQLRHSLMKHLNSDIDGIILFIKFIFPFIRKYDNGPILGINLCNDIKVVDSGGNGIALRSQNILLKIFKNSRRSKSVIRELKNLYKIFYNNKNKRILVPKQINNFIGYITNDINVISTLNTNKNKLLDNYVLCTDMKTRRISKKDMISFHNETKKMTRSEIDYDNILVTSLVLEYEEYQSMNYVKKYINKNNMNKFLFDFINDMYAALYFLHYDRKMIHNDIKYENIVTSYDSHSKRYIFKLIDFGHTQSVDTREKIIPIKGDYGTTICYNGTIFKKYRSFLYDWHCIFVTIFDLCQLTRENCFSLDSESDLDQDMKSTTKYLEDYLYIRNINTDSAPDHIIKNEKWIRIDSLNIDYIDIYMDNIHQKYLKTVDKCLINFIKSIMKFQYYIDTNGKYTIDVNELYKELYLNTASKKNKICSDI